ncbi:DEAD/DEAH box helicase [Flavobacteriales bacterium]|nr:DEAD/DEAH box helicase [Flavobacteriales bacterium]
MEEQHSERQEENKPVAERVRFEDLDLHPDIEDGLWSMGFETATPIQGQAIPHAVKGKDILGIAQTGTGKTAAFLLPTMDRIMDTPNDGKVKALIVVPTRELAIQIDQAAQGFAYYTGITSLAIYGGGTGKEFAQEKKALTEGADIIIVTPGRMLSHLTLGYVDLSSLEVLILDEADRMLDMGFHQDIMRIAQHCRAERQTLLFSATMPDRMRTLAHDLLNDPVTVQLALSKPAAKVKQGAYIVFDYQKDAVLVDVLKDRNVKSGIVFTSRKRTVGQVVRALRKAGIKCGRMSSDLEQSEREEVMLAFRQQKLPILVATDVVSRGIDIDSIELVVNYDVPPNEEDYVHRIGRTARAERKGEGITLVTPDDMRRFGKIEKLIEKEVPKLEVPASLGATPTYDPKSSGSRGRGGNRGGSGGRHGGGRRHAGGSGGGRGKGGQGGGKSFRRKGKPGGGGRRGGSGGQSQGS